MCDESSAISTNQYASLLIKLQNRFLWLTVAAKPRISVCGQTWVKSYVTLWVNHLCDVVVQEARQARIKMVKRATSNMFLQRRHNMIQILESLHHAHENNTDGADIPGIHDIFQLQHHHLLMCLERTTVSTLAYNIANSTLISLTVPVMCVLRQLMVHVKIKLQYCESNFNDSSLD